MQPLPGSGGINRPDTTYPHNAISITNLPVNPFSRKNACASDKHSKGNERASRGLISPRSIKLTSRENPFVQHGAAHKPLILQIERSEVERNNRSCNGARDGITAKGRKTLSSSGHSSPPTRSITTSTAFSPNAASRLIALTSA